MRKLLFVLATLLLSLPVLAQRGNHNENRPRQGNQQFRREPAHHQEHVRDNKREYRSDDRRYNHEARDYRRGEVMRDHREHARFDEHHWQRHFGNQNHFYWGHSRWYGPRFCQNSRFYWGGAWFVIIDPVPYWGDDDVYIDWVDDGYWLYSPYHPGVRIQVIIVP